ncbi:MAG: hypothetical protein R3F62_08255, partial [Planctomycetota bacterium]
GTSRGRQRRASEPEGAAAIPAQRSWAPLAIGVAAALLAAIGLAMWLSGGDEPDPAGTQGVQVATDEGAETPQDEPPTPETPRRGPRRADPVEAPDAAPRELPEVAALERFWEQNPSDAGEAYRRAEAVLALYPGDAAATERAVAVRDASAQALDDELNSLRGRSDSYAQRGELWEARTQYLEFMNRHGADNPASSAAERALSALDVQIAVQLEQDLERLDGLLAEGKVEDAEALARAIRQNAGPEGHAQAVAKLDAQPNAGEQPADGEAAVAVKDPAESPKDPAETPKQPDAQPTPDAEAALAKRKQEASELLAAAQGKLDAGDADGAEELLTKLRKDYADVDDTKKGADELAAAIVTARQPKEPEVFAAFFHAQSVEVQDEGKLVLTYTFESELEAKDWVDDALRRGGRSRVVSRVLEAAGPQVKGAEPWEVRKKALLGFGWSRREHVATFRRDQELTLEVEANGKRNVVVGFNKNETKTDLVAFNFQLDDMPIGPLEKEMLAEKIGDRDGFLRRLFKRVEESQEAGFEVAVFTEQGILGGFDKQFGQRIRPKSKLGFSATLAPHDFGGEEAEGEDAPTHEHALTLKIGRRVGSPIPMEGGPWAKPVLAAFGYPVTFTQIVVKGSLTETFRNRILELAKKGPLETLRQRYDAEEQEKDEKKAKEQAAEDRKRRGGK